MVRIEPSNQVKVDHYQQDNVRPMEDYECSTEPYSLAKFKRTLKMSIIKLEDDELEFDIIGVNPAIANAIRRILLAEVPTMAADRITLMNNTSFIHDKDLTSRVGLVPFRVDSRLFDYRNPDQPATADDTVVFEMKVRCTKNLQAPADATLPKDLYVNSDVYSKHLKWVPLEGQEILFAKNPPKPIHDDILIAKLRPGQEIDMRVECLKGIGKTHAKFSPVATASYRLLPTIEILDEISGEAAHRFKESFSKGVIGIEQRNGKETAKVINARMDTCSRNVLIHEDLVEKVRMGRKKDHFIFSVESVGMLPPDVLVKESIKEMLTKCKSFQEQIKRVRNKKQQAEHD